METLYDWLLHNTGNAGNQYTILNTQRNGTDSLEVMARSSDFNVVNLLIHESKQADAPGGTPDKAGSSSFFRDEQQLIDFLISGNRPELQPTERMNGIRVFITEPDGAAGDITFPTAQP